MTQRVLAATLTFCGIMMMLTSCTDAIGTADNPVTPNPPYDPAGELAQETFIHESYMDRTVKPGDSFWNFALGEYLKQPDDAGHHVRSLNKTDPDFDESNESLQFS